MKEMHNFVYSRLQNIIASSCRGEIYKNKTLFPIIENSFNTISVQYLTDSWFLMLLAIWTCAKDSKFNLIQIIIHNQLIPNKKFLFCTQFFWSHSQRSRLNISPRVIGSGVLGCSFFELFADDVRSRVFLRCGEDTAPTLWVRGDVCTL